MSGTPNRGLAGSTGPPSAGPLQDPVKRQLIQQQLVLLLHAHKCQQRENREAAQCSVPYCSLMKSILEHMTSCQNGRQCDYQHCASSRQIITHWKNCNKDDCLCCKPVKSFNANPSNKKRPEFVGPNYMPGDFAEISAKSTSLLPPSSNAAVNVNNLSTPPTMQPNLSNDGAFGHFLPEPPAHLKEWHNSITQDMRNHLVGKLVKAMFSSPDPAVIHDQRIKDLISYARKVEKDIFEQAADKEAYYHLLAEKIYKIQKEQREKKNRWLNEQELGNAVKNFNANRSDEKLPGSNTLNAANEKSISGNENVHQPILSTSNQDSSTPELRKHFTDRLTSAILSSLTTAVKDGFHSYAQIVEKKLYEQAPTAP